VFKTIELPSNHEVRSIRFDKSGLYLGIVGTTTNIYHMKSWSVVAEYNEHTDIVTNFKFGNDCKYFATTSLDRNLKLFN
jgi:hypothetical protein